jgi:predicted Zn-dependent protease
MESRWTKEGHVYEELGPGKTQDIGKLLLNGASVDRVRNIVNRLVPPYLNPSGFRVYVVENSEWNAFACANGMIVVHSAMLNDMKDDELAIVLGHELVHATHEHTRKQFKRGLWLQIVALGLDAGLEAAGKGKSNTKSAIDALAAVGLLAWKNGYSRELEDQADRVGLRYAYEAGYSVRTAPLLWKRFAEKYKDSNRVVNFFFGDHSLSKDRAVKLDREIELNYSFQQ